MRNVIYILFLKDSNNSSMSQQFKLQGFSRACERREQHMSGYMDITCVGRVVLLVLFLEFLVYIFPCVYLLVNRQTMQEWSCIYL